MITPVKKGIYEVLKPVVKQRAQAYQRLAQDIDIARQVERHQFDV